MIAVVVLGGLAFLSYTQIARSSYLTGRYLEKQQPVQFSHKHHVGDDGIDCRYCHQTVETTATAGMPATQTCMNCHSQLWADSPYLEPVRASFRENKPIQWERVHDLPEYVYFNHSIHVAKGVGCSTCHGQIDTMPGVPGKHASDGVVPGLPPRTREIYQAQERDIQHAVERQRYRCRRTRTAKGRLPH